MTPIRPENRGRYPKDWSEIRIKVLARAKNRCECMGECGCVDQRMSAPRRCGEKNGERAQTFNGTVLLTIAHLNHTPEDNRPENLKAMCQRCHLRYDREHHATTRRKTRERETGQMPLFGD